MKRFLMFSLLMISVIIAKAQFTTVNVVNNSGRTDLYVYLTGNDGTFFPCTPTNTSSSTGPLAASPTSYTFTPGSTPWSPPSFSVMNLNGIGFNIIPLMGPPEPGPIVGLCVGSIPTTPFPYIFSRGSRNNLSFTFSPGAVTVTIDP